MEKILSFGGRTKEPDIRMLYDMSDVIYDQEWLKGAENLELYYMYRDLSLSKKDAQIIKENNLRYDITIIPPRMLG
ncbi:MAG: glucose-6-phosphate isomerase family protein, partial [Methanosarcinales archaeon]